MLFGRAERQCRLQTVGDDGQAGHGAQLFSQQRGGGAGIEEQRLAGLQMLYRRGGNRTFLSGLCVTAHLQRWLRRALQRHQTAMYAARQPLRLKRNDIAPCRFPRNTQLFDDAFSAELMLRAQQRANAM